MRQSIRQSILAYEPVPLGMLYGAESVNVFGAARNPITQDLVAISVQGPSTHIERLWATVYGSQDRQTLAVKCYDDVPYSEKYSTRYMYTNGAREYYQAAKSSITDSMDVSMIIMHAGYKRDADPKKHLYFYEPFVDNDDMVKRVFDRVKRTVHVYVDPRWGKYLYEEGKFTSAGKYPLVVRLQNYKENKVNWTAAGFDIAYVSTDAEAWEKIIFNRIKKKGKSRLANKGRSLNLNGNTIPHAVIKTTEFHIGGRKYKVTVADGLPGHLFEENEREVGGWKLLATVANTFSGEAIQKATEWIKSGKKRKLNHTKNSRTEKEKKDDAATVAAWETEYD